MDNTTFGSSQAAKELVKELNNRPDIKRKVAKFIRSYQIGLEHIGDIRDRQYRIRLAGLWRQDCINKVNFEPIVDVFVKNVMVGSYREFIRKINH